MGHKIVEAIIENKQIKYSDRKLPVGRIKAHIIYDSDEEVLTESEITRAVKETAGIYKKLDVKYESKKLRSNWERVI